MTEIRLNPRKRQLPIAPSNRNKCLCHVENVAGPLILFSDKSWSTFEKCAKRRRDAICNHMEGQWKDGPKGFYHRTCYQNYTDKSKVERAEKQYQNSTYTSECNDQATSVEPLDPERRLSRSHFEPFDVGRCAMCQKNKMKKGTRSREPLTLNMTECASITLMNAAQIRNDKRLLKEIKDQDTIALEIKYHKTCYRDYVRPNSLENIERQNCEEEDATNRSYNSAFDKIKELVKSEVIEKAKAIKMSELLDQYIFYLSEDEVDVRNYRSSKLKSRLTKYFGESLSFQQPINKSQSEIVYSTHVTTGEVVETLMNTCGPDSDNEGMDSEVESCEQADETFQNVYHTAKMICTSVNEMKTRMPWPPTAEDLDCDDIIVPDLLYNMLAWICSTSEYSNTRVCDVAPDVHRVIISLAHDFIHTVSRGRIKTPKHVTLPLTVKSLTGNAELITILNRLGHGLSYSQVEELETALAEREIERQQNGILVPSTCAIGIPGVFCWDNNDLSEETLSGMHEISCVLNFN